MFASKFQAVLAGNQETHRAGKRAQDLGRHLRCADTVLILDGTANAHMPVNLQNRGMCALTTELPILISQREGRELKALESGFHVSPGNVIHGCC